MSFTCVYIISVNTMSVFSLLGTFLRGMINIHIALCIIVFIIIS